LKGRAGRDAFFTVNIGLVAYQSTFFTVKLPRHGVASPQTVDRTDNEQVELEQLLLAFCIEDQDQDQDLDNDDIRLDTKR
jgi:hypothetical protein